jgi:periplasmic protein TonB
MASGDVQVEKATANIAAARTPLPEPVYRPTLVDGSFFLVSLIRQIRERRHEPKITVPKEYYRGEADLPITEMRPWYRDLGNLYRALFEKPVPPPIPLTSKPVAVPDIWRDYPQEPASWLNSVLVHAVAILAVVLPFLISGMLQPKKTATTEVVDISPISLPGNALRTGGGGGGGDRTPTPASQGKAPRFDWKQFTPPLAKILNPKPKLPMPPTLLGPPQMKVPQTLASLNFGDPQGVPAPPSNGPGFGGGIGSGEGTGIGSGRGGGLGPGEGGGTGGGVFSVGGNVSAPIPIYKPEPPYSEEARKAKYQGVVVLSIIVDTQGNVQDVHVVKPLGLGLDEKAEDTVKTWKFKAAQRNGTPVPVRVMVEVTFRLF